MSEPLYGDKALELFFGSNASGVATAMWATAMRNNYEDRVAKLEEQVEFWKNMALGLKDEMVQRGNEIDGLRAQLATAQKWRTRWKAMAKRKRQHHRNALAALGLNITYVRELQQEVKQLDEQVDGLRAQLATAQQRVESIFGGPQHLWNLTEREQERYAQLSPIEMFTNYLKAEHQLATLQAATPVADAEGVVVQADCDLCGGRGGTWDFGGNGMKCPACNGTGKATLQRRPHAQQEVQGGN